MRLTDKTFLRPAGLAAALILGAGLAVLPALAASPVVDRNLFSADRKPPAPPAPAKAPKINLAGLQQLQVKGVMVLGEARRAVLEGPNAVLQSGTAGEPGRITVTVGDEVAGFKIENIDAEGVVFKGEGVTHVVAIHPKKPKAPTPAKASLLPGGRGRAAMVLPWQTASGPDGTGGPSATPGQNGKGGVGAQASLSTSRTDRSPLVLGREKDKSAKDTGETSDSGVSTDSATATSTNTETVYINTGGGVSGTSSSGSGSSGSGSSGSGSSGSGASGSGSSGSANSGSGSTGSGGGAPSGSTDVEFNPPSTNDGDGCAGLGCLSTTATFGGKNGSGAKTELYAEPEAVYNPFSTRVSGNPLGL